MKVYKIEDGMLDLDFKGGDFVRIEHYAALQQKLDAMAAENASMMALAIACEKEFGSYTVEEFPDDEKVSLPEDRCHITFGMIRNALNKTANDAYLNSVRAEGVEMFANEKLKLSELHAGNHDIEMVKANDYAAMSAQEFAEQLRNGTHDTAKDGE